MENSEVKEAAPKYNYYTIDDYLAIERESYGIRHELHEGKLIVMQGSSPNHARVARNLTTAIDNHLKHDHCEVFGNDLKVAIKSIESVVYPDVSVFCADADFYDEYNDVTLNPVAIIEVLSPSTEKYDHDRKFYYYRQIASIHQYIIVGSASHYLFSATRQKDGKWLSPETRENTGSLTIEPIGLTISSEEIYRRVSF